MAPAAGSSAAAMEVSPTATRVIAERHVLAQVPNPHRIISASNMASLGSRPGLVTSCGTPIFQGSLSRTTTNWEYGLDTAVYGAKSGETWQFGNVPL
jgi:hypothetical protein